MGPPRYRAADKNGTIIREMTAEWLLGWWNLIYVIPFGLALAYLTAYVASGWTFGDLDADADLDADVDVDADLEIDAEADLGAEGDLAHPHGLHTPGHDIDADSAVGQGGSILNAVAWLGVGRVPLSILLMVLCFAFGALGFFANQLLREALGAPAVAAVSLPVAILGGLALTSLVANAIAKWMPMNETSARLRREFVGSRATTVFPVDAGQGLAVVRGPEGDRYQIPCRTLPGREAIAARSEVVIVKYVADDGLFFVVPSGLAESTALPV